MAIFNSYVQFPEGTSLHIPTSDDSLGFHPFLMVKEKVSARVLTADAPELNFRGKKKLEKLIVFR